MGNLKTGLTDAMMEMKQGWFLGITAMGPSFNLLDTFFNLGLTPLFS